MRATKPGQGQAEATEVPYRLDRLDYAMLELVTTPIAVCASDGRYVHVNRATEDATGYTLDQLRGRSLWEHAAAEDQDHARDEFERAVQENRSADFEIEIVRPDGRLITVLNRLTPLVHSGTVVGVLCVSYLPMPRIGRTGPLHQQPALTPRQHEILTLLAAGAGTQDIATSTGIAVDTVRNHIRALTAALGTNSRVEAVAVARRLGLLPAQLTPPEYRVRRRS